MPQWLVNWLQRHQHPVSLGLHVVGIPLTICALIVAGFQLAESQWDLWWWPTLLLVTGYLLQWLGHAIEGNDMGELILFKRWLGRDYVAISPRYSKGTPPPRRIPLRVRYLCNVVGNAFKVMGLKNSDRFARALARRIYQLNPPARKLIESNLQAALGNPEDHPDHPDTSGNALAERVFENIASFWTELLFCRRLLSPAHWRQQVTVHNESAWAKLGESSQPTILVTGYFGNPAIGACVVSELLGPVHVGVDPAARMLIHAAGEPDLLFSNLKLLDADRIGQRAPTLLKANQRLMLLAGQTAYSGGVDVDFLGRSCHLHATVARLAIRHQARIVVFGCRRISDELFRFELSAPEIIQPAGRPASATATTRVYLAVMEKLIKADPEQYLWTRPGRRI